MPATLVTALQCDCLYLFHTGAPWESLHLRNCSLCVHLGYLLSLQMSGTTKYAIWVSSQGTHSHTKEGLLSVASLFSTLTESLLCTEHVVGLAEIKMCGTWFPPLNSSQLRRGKGTKAVTVIKCSTVPEAWTKCYENTEGRAINFGREGGRSGCGRNRNDIWSWL